MRSLLVIPLGLLLVAAVGTGACASAGRSFHTREMLLAAAAAFLASSAGASPVILARNASQLGVSQAALVGSMLHLFTALVLAAAVVFGHLAPVNPFLFWLLSFYWITLIALVVVFTKSIKSAAKFAASPKP